MKRGGIITLWLLGAGLLAVLALAFGSKFSGLFGPGKDPMAPGPPHVTLTFGDGYRLEVFGISQAEWSDGEASPGSAGWQFGTSGRRSEGFGRAEAGLQIDHYERNGKLSGIRYRFNDCEPLLVSLRLLSPSGVPVDPADWAEDELEMRLIDADCGRLLGLGPHGADDDPERRAVAIFPAWPRSVTDLVFEATRPGEPPRSFRFPNPATGATPAKWTPAPLPQTRSGPDWDLTLVNVTLKNVPGKGTLLDPHFKFTSRIPKTDGIWPAVSGQGADLECGWGTKTAGITPSWAWGFPIPSDEDLFKFRYRITYDESYPYPRSDAHILLLGKVNAAGLGIDVISRHPTFGIDTIDLGPLGTPSGSRTKATHSFSMRLEGKWSTSSDRAAAEAMLGPWDNWGWVIFLDGSAQAVGEISNGGWGTSSSGVSSSESFNRQGEWSGNLKPGSKVEVGLVRGKPDEFIEFVIDRSALTPR